MATKGGLQRGSEDYRAILEAFKNKTYRTSSYSAQTVLHSNPAWVEKYDPAAFTTRLRNLVATLHLQRPSKPKQAEASASNDLLPNNTGMMEPNHPEMFPSGQEEISDEHPLKTPKVGVAWIDASPNQNN